MAVSETVREVVIAEYDPAWPARFGAEAAGIQRAAADAIVAIHHAGSTSVPGLAAKPIVDIFIELKRPLNEAEIAGICSLDFDYRGEYGISGRQYFSRRNDPQCHIHAHLAGSRDLLRTLAFRDYLRAHLEAAAQYETLKRRLAIKHRFEREAYTDAKTDFVRGIEALAGFPAR
jgi:GrpB-like predicted nucleotidyltransferase (UPF0157 family)